MNARKLNEEFKKIKLEYSQKNYEKVIEIADYVLEDNPYLIQWGIIKINAILLLENGYEKYGSLNDLLQILHNYILVDESSIYARLEYAHFLHSVTNNIQEAYKVAKDTLNLCESFTNECKKLIYDCEKELI